MGRVELAERRIRNAVVRTRLSFASDHPALDREGALTDAVAADRILFLCLGNICRSPLAERYAGRLFDALDADVEVDSAGFVEREGRPSPPNAVEAAADYGVDLTDHRSRRVGRGALESADVVFVMDVRNYRDLARTARPGGSNVYFLGPLAGDGGPFEISDPHGGGPAAFDRAYARTTHAVDAIVSAFAEHRP